ncbi:MAG: hypothetical protein ABSC23_07335 [Bryobacteraceae bacterium]|jgi:hypothetical protein
METANALAFALLALADLALIAHLRRISQRRERAKRMMRSLQLVLTREAFAEAVLPQKRLLRRAC